LNATRVYSVLNFKVTFPGFRLIWNSEQTPVVLEPWNSKANCITCSDTRFGLWSNL